MQCVDLRCAELHQLTPHFVQRQYRLLLLSFHSDGFSRLLNRIQIARASMTSFLLPITVSASDIRR